MKWQRKILAFTKHSRCHWIGHLRFVHFPSPLTLWLGIRIRILSFWSKGFEPSFKITRLGLPPWTGHHMMHLATNTSVGRWIPIVPLPSHCHKQLLCEHNLWDIKTTKPKPITKPHNPHYNHIEKCMYRLLALTWNIPQTNWYIYFKIITNWEHNPK